MILRRHPRATLVLAAEGRLEADERLRLDTHLAGCPRCRRELSAIETAMEALKRVEPAPPRVELRQRIVTTAAAGARRATGTPLAATARPSRRFSVAGAAAAAAAALAIAALALAPARVRVVSPSSGTAPLPFEQLALEAHRALGGDRPELELASGEAAAIRTWLEGHGELSAALVGEGFRDDAARVRLLGARGFAGAPRPAAAVAARIDGLPVTLLVGRERDAAGIPAWGWLGKELLVRREAASGVHLLSWRNAGKAYTLVTDPGVRPELACELCHVDERRRAAIRRVAEQL